MTFDRFLRLASIPALALCLFTFFTSAVQAASIALLRDADIEQALTRLSTPVLQAAGLNAKRVKILVVNDSSFNAFVVDSRTIFVNYGLILKVTSPEMLQAVIAHEAAHITNGHIGRRMQNMRSAGSAAGLGMALAVLAAAAGAPSDAAAGIAIGTQSSALRGFLAHTRAEESSADRSAAGYLKRAGITPQGLVDLHQAFSGQELLSTRNQDPYMRSHPLNRDRIRAAQAFVASQGSLPPPRPEDVYWFARVRGKISGFTRASKWSLRRAKEENHKDIRLMRESIAHLRNSDFKKALTSINNALAIRPNDAYYYELKGQILSEHRQWSAALASYSKARDLAPSDALILASLGRAQLAAGQTKAALKTMERSRSLDFRNTILLREMARAYAKTGQNGMASVVTAERYALQGRLDDAGLHAKRAVGLLPAGSPAWRRAQDVLSAYEQTQRRKR